MKKLIFAITLFLFTSFSSVFAQSENGNQTLSPYFIVNGSNTNIDVLPLKSTTADVKIAGMIADVTVRQMYVNRGNKKLEAIYVFPASTRAAVYGLQMKIGKRVINAKIKEREQARNEYEQAKSEGKSASLLEQERPNVFQMNVANIRPNDSIEVMLQYTELIVPEDGIYSFIYPTVVGPRYNSKQNPQENDKFIATPYLKKGSVSATVFDIKVHLASGVPFHNIHSKTHWIDVTQTDNFHAETTLKKEDGGRGNKDFILNYGLKGNAFASGVILYEHKDENYFMAMVQPPKAIKTNEIPPREYIFIVDVSGSMGGFPLDVSKTLLRNLVSNLRSDDYFNVLLFAGSANVLSEKSLPATKANIEKAIQCIDNQQGGGGTELLPAMQKALNLPRADAALSRSMVLVTDGFISVEREAFDLIRNNLDKTNVFAFGIGSSVNRYLMEGIAHTGQGEPFVVLNKEEAPTIAEKFRKYINTPALSQVKVNFDGFDTYDVEPKTLPDVMSERPIIIFGKYKGKPKGKISITAFSGKKKMTQTINVAQNSADAKNTALRYLWAREKIHFLDDYRQAGENDEIKKEVTNLGLKYNLLTAYTSFIAIDETPVLDKNGDLVTVKQAIPLPEGVDNSAVGYDFEIEEIFDSSSSKGGYFAYFAMGVLAILMAFFGIKSFFKN